MTAKADTSTHNYAPDQLRAGDAHVVTENETAVAAIAANVMVGRVTASGKIKASTTGASDGSENPIGITAIAATAADDVIAVYKAGEFNIDEIDLGDFTDAAAQQAFEGTPLFLKALV